MITKDHAPFGPKMLRADATGADVLVDLMCQDAPGVDTTTKKLGATG